MMYLYPYVTGPIVNYRCHLTQDDVFERDEVEQVKGDKVMETLVVFVLMT